MRFHIGDTKRLSSGLLFLAIGGLGMVYGARYRMGTAGHMGPGYFPFVVSALIATLGVASALSSLQRVTRPDDAPTPIQWHAMPLFFILSGVVLFGLLVEHAGLVLAIAAVVFLGCYQRLRSRPMEVLIIGGVLIAVSVGLFIHGLGMPWHALPS